jgi:hypothetical protein
MLERLVPNGGLRSGGAEACSPSGDIVSGADATRGRMVPDGCGPRSGGDEAASAPGGVVGDAGAMHGWLLPRGVGGAGRMRGRSPLGGVVGGAGTTRGWLAPGGRPCLCDAAACSPPGGGGPRRPCGGRLRRAEAGRAPVAEAASPLGGGRAGAMRGWPAPGADGQDGADR